MQHFIGITTLFVIYNIYYLLSAIHITNQTIDDWFYPTNMIGIAIYLVVINWKDFRRVAPLKWKVLGVVFSILLTIFAFNLGSVIPMSLETLNAFTFNIIPVLLTLTVVSLAVSVSKRKARSFFYWILLSVPILIVIFSFLVDFDDSELWRLILTNTSFLLFAGLKYFYLYLEKRVAPLPQIKQADPLDKFGLTKTQKEITRLIVEGHSYDEIAKLRHVGHSTVTSHASKIFSKTNVHSREELVKKLRENN
ncbi:MAG: LuxR C-terminal-related transcriptional regulator [bacterium]|nr:LuxR C-terminal-related transcriptional regulator [bacterium]